MDLSVLEADITEVSVDAIVNAANSRMRGGAGVDGAIHAAAGPDLLQECIERFPHGLPTGEAGWTHGHLLTARWVIFPLVSAGIYGWPREDAIAAAVDTLRDTPTSVQSAVLVAYGRKAFDEISAFL
jgi:O-acetyl-ADP-ribose deacetylase (regulator of RNase III)